MSHEELMELLKLLGEGKFNVKGISSQGATFTLEFFEPKATEPAKQFYSIDINGSQNPTLNIPVDGTKINTSSGVTVETPPASFIDPAEAFKHASPLDDLSEEEIKYYSTPYFEEIQAKKKLHEESLKIKES